MRGEIDKEGCLYLFLSEEKLIDLENNHIIEDNFRYRFNGFQEDILLKIKLYNKDKALFDSNFSGLESLGKYGLELKVGRIALDILKEGEGLITDGATYVYSPKYTYFELLFKNLKNHNNTY